MSKVHAVLASLRIFGGELDPDEITRLLGREPTKVQRRGHPLKLPSGKEGRLIDFSSWTLEAERTSPGDLDAQIAWLLQGTTNDLTIWTRIVHDYRIDVFSGLFLQNSPEGISLSSKSLLALGERGINLDLDIYGGFDSGLISEVEEVIGK